jgi:hypothetical protein
VLEKNASTYIHPEREYIEYLHFLYGILDDTDLLMKVSLKDVEIVASLLNRMKSIVCKKQVEIISFEGIERNKDFVKNAAQVILQNKDMYTIYKKVYAFREKEVEKNMRLCVENQPHNLFADTKEQNGCCRIGQTKVFAKNMQTFHRYSKDLRKVWVHKAQALYKDRSEYDLHIQMISTIVGAEEVYKGIKLEYHHKDELWVWIPESDLAQEHLKRFLNAFQDNPQLAENHLEIEYLGNNAQILSQLFNESFLQVPIKIVKADIPMAVLYYKAGILNSRKTMVSPYLPSVE